jgi:hypothetical protein
VHMSSVKEPKFFAFEGGKPDFQARFLPRSPETLLRIVREGEDRGVPLRGLEQGRGRRFAKNLPLPRGGRRFRAGYLAAAQCLGHPQEPRFARVGQDTERRGVLPEAAPARRDTQAALGKRAELGTSRRLRRYPRRRGGSSRRRAARTSLRCKTLSDATSPVGSESPVETENSLCAAPSKERPRTSPGEPARLPTNGRFTPTSGMMRPVA